MISSSIHGEKYNKIVLRLYIIVFLKKRLFVNNILIRCLSSMQEEFEDTKGVIRISVYRRRTDNTMVKGKGTKGHTTIYKSYI